MVIRGRKRGNGKQLGDYLLAKGENDNILIFDIRGTSQMNDVKKSILEMSFTSELTKSRKGLYHAQINPAPGEDRQMTREDWLKAAKVLEDELKLSNQKRVIVLHEKKDRVHAHVVWERYDHDNSRMVSDSYSRLAQDRARQNIEQILYQKRTPERNQNRPEMKRVLSELWEKTKTAKDFVKEALANGYTIARGELRRPFMVVDRDARSFDLVRQINGARSKDVKERLKGQKLEAEKDAIEKIRNDQRLEKGQRMMETFADMLEQQKQRELEKAKEKEKEKQDILRKAEAFQKSRDDMLKQGEKQKSREALLSAFAENKTSQQENDKEKKAKAREELKKKFLEQMNQTTKKKDRSSGHELFNFLLIGFLFNASVFIKSVKANVEEIFSENSNAIVVRENQQRLSPDSVRTVRWKAENS